MFFFLKSGSGRDLNTNRTDFPDSVAQPRIRALMQ
jgi:hypothetical protein